MSYEHFCALYTRFRGGFVRILRTKWLATNPTRAQRARMNAAPGPVLFLFSTHPISIVRRSEELIGKLGRRK
jgi:hypothetical protein